MQKVSFLHFRKGRSAVLWYMLRPCFAVREGKLLQWRQQLEAASGTHAKGFCPGELVFGMAAPARSNVRRNHES